jgi:hypothetical protein
LFAFKCVQGDELFIEIFHAHIQLLVQIESNPITGFLLKANAGVCWQVFVRNSKCTNNGYGDPFG